MSVSISDTAVRSLENAVCCDDLAGFCSILREDIDLQARLPDPRVPSILHRVVMSNKFDFLVQLLSLSPSLSVNNAGDTPLHLAARWSDNASIIRLLITSYGADSSKNMKHETFLHHLSLNDRLSSDSRVQLFRWMLQRDDVLAILNSVNVDGHTPLDMILLQFHRESVLVSLLLNCGALSAEELVQERAMTLDCEEQISRRELIDLEEKQFSLLMRDSASHVRHIYRTARRIRKLCRQMKRYRRNILQEEFTEYLTLSGYIIQLNELCKRERIQKEESRSLIYAVELWRSTGEVIRLQNYKKQSIDVIRRIFQGYFSRHQLHLLACRKRSSILMQRIGRGYLTRIHVYEMRSVAQRLEFCKVLQRIGRSYFSRMYVSSLACQKRAIIVIQGLDTQDLSRMHTYPRSKTIEISSLGSKANDESDHKEGAHENGRKEDSVNKEKIEDSSKIHFIEIVTSFVLAKCVNYKVMRMKSAVHRIENFWLRFRRDNLRISGCLLPSVDQVKDDISSVSDMTGQLHYRLRISKITKAVTRLLWRENFCCLMAELVFQAKRRRSPVKAPLSAFQKIKSIQTSVYKYILLAQYVISFVELVYMGIVPRRPTTTIHNSVDIGLIGIQITLSIIMPISLSSIADFCIAVFSLICAATNIYEGAIGITVFLLKFPFLIRAFKSDHPGSNTFCRSIENTFYFLFVLSPIFLAFAGGITRYSARNDLLLTYDGNVGSVFFFLWSNIAAQLNLVTYMASDLDKFSYPAGLSRINNVRRSYNIDDDVTIVTIYQPLISVMIFRMSLSIYLWTSIIVGVNSAIRTHYDISDQTKLKRNKSRFKSYEEAEPLDAHRAANIETLGDVLDGAMMENDVQTAKEAIDASYDAWRKDVQLLKRQALRPLNNWSNESVDDRNTFLNEYSTATSNWNCRKEHPSYAGAFDAKIIEVALGKIDRKGKLETIVERQLTGHFFRRESTYIILIMVVLESIFPNTYTMECIFGSLLLVEFLVTLYVLDFSILCTNIVSLLVRVMSFTVGLVPAAIPVAAFRAFRLFEGWSGIFQIPGVIFWDLGYCLISFLTMWMIGYVSSLQFLANHEDRSFCHSKGMCLGMSLREMVLSAWTDTHIRPENEGLFLQLVIVFFQLVVIPFFLTFLLHPLLRLSSFIGRFLRLVIQALHNDLLEYLKHYFEGESWYSHWRFYEPLPAKVIVTLKVWASTCRKNFHKSFPKSGKEDEEYVVKRKNQRAFAVLPEVIASGTFASFEECSPVTTRHKRAIKAILFLRGSFWFAYLNVGVNIISLIFVFVVTPWGLIHPALVVFAVFFHLASIVFDVINVPFDLTAFFTVASAVTLLLSTSLLVLRIDGLMELYELRYVSLIRITQLSVYPFSAVRFFLKPYVLSLVSILFPTLVLGVLVYTAELLRSQIYLVSHRHSYNSLNYSTLSYSEKLASHSWRHDYPNTEDVRDLFRHYFSENAFIYMTIFNQWLMPTMCISTCLVYLFWSGSNLMDKNFLLIELIPLLEDPIAIARYHARHPYWKWIGDIGLVLGLAFNCIFSPDSDLGKVNPVKFYFSFEILFTFIGLCHAFYLLQVDLGRCIRSSDNRRSQQQNFFTLVLVGEAISLLACVAEILYFSLLLPLSFSLLFDPTSCVVSLEIYATYLVSVRFFFLLRMLPRAYFLCILKDLPLFLYGMIVMLLFFIGATSTIADVAVLRTETNFTAELWMDAFQSFLRSTFTYALPHTDIDTWIPFNATEVYENMTSENVVYKVTARTFSMSLMMLLLTIAGKVISASTAGFIIALFLSPLSTLLCSPLPPKSKRLYWALAGGVSRIAQYGHKYHDDMKPDVRESAQTPKLTSIFYSPGIPCWSIPHLLEELNICRPTRQRRFMFSLEQLLIYLPISEERRKRVNEFVMQLDIYKSGGPTKLSFTSLPTFPPIVPAAQASNPYNMCDEASAGSGTYSRYVNPLRLIQAISLFEMSFPTDSSIRTKHWIEFVSVAQKIRAATLLQSLWRMYSEEVLFDMEHSGEERSTIRNLRSSFRRLKIKENVKFRLHSSFVEALRSDHCAFNPSSGHTDVLIRLQNHYSMLTS